MATVPLVDLKAQYATIRHEIDPVVARVLAETSFIMGPEVKAFDAEFAEWIGAPHAMGVSSGTDALHLCLRALGVGAGDEVITSAMSFVATAEAIVMAGATPVFIDIDPRTCNIDPALIAAKLTPRTKAIIPVHLYGQPADMDPILELAKARGIAVIEDAAQAHGAKYKGRPVGTLGDAACFSFYPGKNLGAYGDAGAVTTTRDDLADRIRMIRDHGRRSKYEHLIDGYGNRIDALQAAILRVKLRHLTAWTAARRRLAAEYTAALTAAGIVPAFGPSWADPVWHLYVIRAKDRPAVQAALKGAGYESGVHYPIPLHRQPVYHRLGYAAGSLPVAEAAANEVLSLPIFPEMDPGIPAAVVRSLTSVIEATAR
jgi:dTDP-4-amino-4,6-dideoxygalactose transaminase